MIRATVRTLLMVCFLASPLAANPIGTASGTGVIERQVASPQAGGGPETEKVPFAPRFAFAYRDTGGDRNTWLVLTEKQPPVAEWLAAGDRAEARRLWCQREQASFVAAEINAEGGVELYFLCPGNGSVNTEMVSTSNGLASVAVTFERRDDARLKGTLRGGDGWCGEGVYCETTENYAFDAPLAR